MFLYNGKLTVTFSGGSVDNAGGVTSGPAAALDNGFEVTVDIPTGTNFAVNQFYVNQAIKAAINDNAVLKNLLKAEDGPSNTLLISSKVDGEVEATDLKISIASSVAAEADVSDAALTAFQAFSHNSAATKANVVSEITTAVIGSVAVLNAVEGIGTPTLGQELVFAGGVFTLEDITGADGFAETDNSIELGLGDDVAVLSTSALSSETLVFKGYALGKDTVVNFTDNNGAVATEIDKLDFTSYLTSKASLSGSVVSQKTIVVTLNTDAIAEANSVTVLDSAVFNTTTDTFAGLTAAKLLSALNTTTGYAGLSDASLNTPTLGIPANQLVGGVGKAVVMIENNLNDGEYAVFELTFNGSLPATSEPDFTAAQLIGVVDFGNSVVLDAAQLIGS